MGWLRDTFQENRIERNNSVANRTQINSRANAADIGYIDK